MRADPALNLGSARCADATVQASLRSDESATEVD